MRTLCNLAALTGSVGTADGCGANPLRGQNNVQGASDMGAMPDILPGYQKVADPEVAEPLRRGLGGRDPGPSAGCGSRRCSTPPSTGALKALIVFGEDIAQTDPDSGHVRAAIDACELVVSQEIFLSETAALADVVLPAASFLEKDGTFTNFDRRVQRVRPALDAAGRGAARLRDHPRARRAALGADLGCPTPAEAFAEMASLTPTFARHLSRAARPRGPARLALPRRPREPGERTLYRERFATPSGKAQLAAIPYAPPGEQPDAEFPILLVTGRQARALQRRHDDAADAAISSWFPRSCSSSIPRTRPSSVSATASGCGSPAAAARSRSPPSVTERVSPGQAFMGFHFPEALANLLTSQHGDEVTELPRVQGDRGRVRSAA